MKFWAAKDESGDWWIYEKKPKIYLPSQTHPLGTWDNPKAVAVRFVEFEEWYPEYNLKQYMDPHIPWDKSRISFNLHLGPWLQVHKSGVWGVTAKSGKWITLREIYDLTGLVPLDFDRESPTPQLCRFVFEELQ